jgi:glutamate-5-semialdehyde dehydrogenase
MPDTMAGDDIRAEMRRIATAARAAMHVLGAADTATKNAALGAAAGRIRDRAATLLDANARDLDEAAGRNDMTDAFRDRLELDDGRVEGMAAGLEAIAELPDPVGDEIAAWDRPNGLRIARVRVPLGVIGIIYESRPNVTADAGGLCLKSGNAAILRGGSESFHSTGAIMDCLHFGLAHAGLPEAAIQRVPTRDRAAVGAMLAMPDLIDVIVPRGGKSLIERVQNESRIPVIAHLDGNCHVYIEADADPEMARAVAFNAKMRRPGICGAAETLLVDAAVASDVLPPILADLAAAGCEIRGDAATQALDSRVVAATEADWDTEYLDAIIAVKQVRDLDDAIDHVNTHGSHHTDAIVTRDPARAQRFLDRVDSAIVLHNASTQFADGGEFGMGAEIGISTGRLHARGPVGVEQLTTYKYVVRGTGQVRP